MSLPLLISSSSFAGYDLKYDELNNRLNCVKKEFGLRRAVSTHSLTGETRTFAEILDTQVETVVLYYLEVQGILAKQLRLLREQQMNALQDCIVSMPVIDDMCFKYRQIGMEVLDLLHYLERNSHSLRKILSRHDTLFDQKMGSMYFDTRFGPSNKHSQLRQLYHQEGVKALVASIRRGFEELYDARNSFLSDTQQEYGRDSPLLGRSFDGSIIPASGRDSAYGIKLIPKVRFRKRLASFSNLKAFSETELEKEKAENSSKSVVSSSASPSSSSKVNTPLKTPDYMFTPVSGALSDTLRRNVFSTSVLDSYQTNPSFQNTLSIRDPSSSTRERSLSDLEPILHEINDVAQKLLKAQNKTVEFFSSYSSMGLELSMTDLRRAEENASDDSGEKKESSITTSTAGLYINLFLTFLYLSNQYIVAPSSAQYANKLGMSPSMSGMIIGLAPFAALVSSLLYSMWSNYSFKAPLLVSICCAIAGNLFYAMALQFNSTVMLFAGRLITGFCGTRVISRRYIADHVSLDDRLFASSEFVTAGALGLAFGPLLAAIVERANISFIIHGYTGASVWIQYENVTAPGWIMTALWSMSLVAVLFYFQEPKITVSLILIFYSFLIASFTFLRIILFSIFIFTEKEKSFFKTISFSAQLWCTSINQ
jgi:hypothetical protein